MGMFEATLGALSTFYPDAKTSLTWNAVKNRFTG